jgi:hypothetical protein
MSLFLNGVDRTPLNSLVLLNAATGNEISNQINYTVNKVTSGNDSGLVITMTDTLSPGTSLGLHCLHGSNTVLAVDMGNERVGIGTTIPLQKLDIEKGHIRLGQVTAPTAPSVAVGAAGVLTGNYYYQITFVTSLGETEAGTESVLVAPSTQKVELTNIPVSSDSAVTSRNIYRTTAGGVAYQMKLVATLANNTTTVYSDNIADGSLGVYQPWINSTGGLLFNGTTRVGIIDHETTAIGMNALRVNTGISNTAFGTDTLYSNTIGYDDIAVGRYALRYNTIGYENVVLGVLAFSANISGYKNTVIGHEAGWHLADGSSVNETSNTSIFMGYDSRAYIAGGSNEIVIGASAIGAGSNSVVLGNDSITLTKLKGNVGIGTSPNSKLQVAGSLSLPIVTKAFADTGYTATITDYTILCNAVGGAITINLPTAVGITGRIYKFKKTDSSANVVTIDGNAAETIDGSATLVISTQYTSFEIQSDNANWWIT